jgi:hypothetical protein
VIVMCTECSVALIRGICCEILLKFASLNITVLNHDSYRIIISDTCHSLTQALSDTSESPRFSDGIAVVRF